MELDPQQSHEEFLRLFTQHEANVRAFVSSLLPTWEGVDEVMQETSLVLWRKFDQFDPHRPGSKFIDWAFMVARYEVLRYRRKWATDRLVFSDDVHELLASEAAELAAEHQPEQRLQALRGCVARLEPAQQELVRTAYADGISIKDAASLVGRTPTGLYKALARIRRNLRRCIELSLSASRRMEGSA
ncbi:MAG: sigma-70 family RNA polymerase sigma factor [Verrucomicrobiota bacterium]